MAVGAIAPEECIKGEDMQEVPEEPGYILGRDEGTDT